MKNEKKERMLELLSYQAIFELNEEERVELNRLKNQFPHLADNNSFELAAASIGMSDIRIVEMPESLRLKILKNAENYFDYKLEAREFSSIETDSRPAAINPEPNFVEVSPAVVEKSPFWQWFGWGLAVAASILLAINLWTTRFQPQTEIAKDTKTIQTPTPELSIAQKRDQLVAAAPDIIKAKVESPKDNKDLSGDVVWSNSLQKGYITFRGLPANNPAKETYQLWIFDETQDDKYPVSGGVFDVNENGEIIVPINAELKIKNPVMFALTGEKPGGVVVSDRKKLVALAKI